MDKAEDENAATKVQKKKEPGKRCVVMFCNKTNADGVSLHKFPTEETRRRQWINFVLAKRDDNWKQGSGHICSSHFSPDCYDGLGSKIAGFSSKVVLKSTAVPTIQANPTPEQLHDARLLKRKRPSSASNPAEENKSGELEEYTTPKRSSRALSKLTAHRVSNTRKHSVELISFWNAIVVFSIDPYLLLSTTVTKQSFFNCNS